MCCGSAQGLNLSPLYHLTAVLLFGISSLFILLVLFDGAPITSTPLYAPKQAFWLLTLNETATSTDPANAAHQQLKFGFGAMGYCQWSYVTPNQAALCKSEPLYQISNDSIGSFSQLDLPPSIGNALSITGFFLIFSALLSLVPTALMIHAAIVPKTTRKKDGTTVKEGGRGAKLMNNSTYRWAHQLIFFLTITPVEITSWVALGHAPDGMIVSLGMGSAVLIAADVMTGAGFAIVMYAGLYDRTEKPVRKTYAQATYL